MTKKFEIQFSCNCGDVRLLISGSPAARAYCHCASCRNLYDLPVLSAVAWSRDSIQVTDGHHLIATYKHPTKRLARHFCQSCGTTVFSTNRLDLRLVRTSLIAKAMGGTIPADLRPEFHLFYAQREVTIQDGLPKYLEGWDGPLFPADRLPET